MTDFVRMSGHLDRLGELYASSDDVEEEALEALDESIESLEKAFVERYGEALNRWIFSGNRNGIDRILEAVTTSAGLGFVERLLAESSDTVLMEDPDGRHRAVSLILIPLVGVFGERVVLDGDTVQAVAAGLQQFGFVGDEPAVLICPQAVRLDETNIHPCSRHRLVARFARGLAAGDKTILQEAFTDPFFSERVGSDQPALRLRYLVGVVSYAVNEANADLMRTTLENQGAWTYRMSDLLAEALGLAAIKVGCPDYFHDAVREGVGEHNVAKVMLLIHSVTPTAELSSCSLVVEDNPDEPGVTLSIVDAQGNYLGGVEWDMLNSDSVARVNYDFELIREVADSFGLALMTAP